MFLKTKYYQNIGETKDNVWFKNLSETDETNQDYIKFPYKKLGGKEFIHLNRYSDLRTKVRNFELRALGWIFVTCMSMRGSLIIGETAHKSIKSETSSVNSINKKHQW